MACQLSTLSLMIMVWLSFRRISVGLQAFLRFSSLTSEGCSSLSNTLELKEPLDSFSSAGGISHFCGTDGLIGQRRSDPKSRYSCKGIKRKIIDKIYLPDWKSKKEIRCRIGSAKEKYYENIKHQAGMVDMTTKKQIVKSLACGITLCGNECWTMKK